MRLIAFEIWMAHRMPTVALHCTCDMLSEWLWCKPRVVVVIQDPTLEAATVQWMPIESSDVQYDETVSRQSFVGSATWK